MKDIGMKKWPRTGQRALSREANGGSIKKQKILSKIAKEAKRVETEKSLKLVSCTSAGCCEVTTHC